MCGIAGIWDPTQHTESLERIATAMTEVLYRRGPDGHGLWTDPRGAVSLGHRRLSIVDLSVHGKQPMKSESGRFVITYNGEIYNRDELRAELGRSAESFRGHSDTEVALAVIEKFGLAGAAKRFNGMFALALWDREEQSLSLLRDRLGIKPLFYGRAGDALLFGSQSSALRQVPQFDPSLDSGAVAAYLRASCIPAPLCIYRDARKVMPGTVVRFESPTSEPSIEQYWDPLTVALEGEKHRHHSATFEKLVDELDELLTDSVNLRLMSDVPLGAFLSGGIDSSTVVALMAKLSAQPVKTFTIGTREASHDESSDAKAIARHLGTEHHELIATPDDALAVVRDLPLYYDEPFADSSQIPTFLVSRLAREHVTVSLSGDGGDELFGGYNRHLWAPRVATANRLMPSLVRAGLASALKSISPDTVNEAYRRLVPKFGAMDVRVPADKLFKLASAMASGSDHGMYQSLANNHADPSEVLLDRIPTDQLATLPPLKEFAEQLMWMDMTGYLPNDILCKVDRASMAVSLESRVPLLDHRVVEFAWRVPLAHKIKSGQGKRILRKVLSRYVPTELVDRPKSGFGIPLADWLRGPLRDWADELFNKDALDSVGMFRSESVLKSWHDHRDGRRDNNVHLWDMLVFLQWNQFQSDGAQYV